MHRLGQVRFDVSIPLAEHPFDQLANQHGERPSGEQRVERPRVERANQVALDHPADRAADDDRDRYGAHDRQAHALHHDHRISTEHHELAVRHVEHAEQPEDHGEAESDQRQRRQLIRDIQQMEKDRAFHRRRKRCSASFSVIRRKRFQTLQVWPEPTWLKVFTARKPVAVTSAT